MSIALMISGNLGLKVFEHLVAEGEVKFVFTDKKSDAIQEKAKEWGIPCFSGNPRGGKTKDFIGESTVDILLSINYLFIIEKDLIKWPKKVAVNFHGSLLPKYRGRTPHVWAIINNEKETGITAHIITEGCDEGAIVNQKVIPIKDDDTGANILTRYAEHYPQMVDEVISSAKCGNLVAKDQDHKAATYFGKRTPSDGQINWDWQKERIRNWVRAQAYPYPGAFTNCQGTILIIDELIYDNSGFQDTMPNGQVISTKPLRIKTPNGVVHLAKVRPFSGQIEPGAILK